MQALITILDGITETSMPFHEFVLYRANHYPNEKQFLIICGSPKKLPQVTIPDHLEIIYAGRNLLKIRRTITGVMQTCEDQNLPYAIHTHQVQSGFLAEIAMLGTNFRQKNLFTVHSTFSGYPLHNQILSFTNALLAKRITCVSRTSFADYPAMIKAIKGERIQAIQNGVDSERIDSVLSVAEQRKPQTDCVNFIYVARMVPVKNHSFLVDVLKKCDSNVHVTFVGAEDGKKTVRRKAEAAGVADRITFTGLIPRNAVFQQLQGADCYISSSTLEGLPVSVLEAMYCGLPCILSDIPQHREVAGEQALILPFHVETWCAEMNRFAALPVNERERRSQNIRQYVLENFTLEAMHKKYDVLYELLK